MSDPGLIRLLIVDDQGLFAQLLKTVLETRSDDFTVVGLASNGQEALERAQELKPDVILLDIKMPGLDGVACARELLARDPGTRIIMLTTFDDEGAVHATIDAGVAGYILKDCEPEVLFSAIHTVHSGASTVSPSILKKLAGPRSSSLPDLRSLLNRREQEILVLVAEGLENREIADRLFIAEQTVKNNMSNLYEKLEVKDRSKLVKIAEAFVASRTSG